MEIIVGKTAGFCFGVKNAVESSKKDLLENNNNMYCLGELVHNKQVIKDLEDGGMIFVDDISKAQNKVIIRAHGVPKEVYEIAKEKNIEIKDYTCPNVLKIHKLAQKYADENYYIILLGDKNHPENIGTISYCGDNHIVVENEEEMKNVINDIKNSNIKKVLLISQTTFSSKKFLALKEMLIDGLSEDVTLKIENTICVATEIRQAEVEELAQKVDSMIIIGGKKSSNTKKLFEIASKYCDKVICVETKDEIDVASYKDINTLGIMAGASTPGESIEEVKNLFE